MNIFRIADKQLKSLDTLFELWNDTCIWSCLQGCMGSAWANSELNPKSAQIVIADFCFFTGEINESLVKNKPQDYNSDFVIMVPQNEEWGKLIEDIYKENATRITRYAIKKELDIFDEEKLKRIVESIGTEYELKFIDEKAYLATKESKWSYSLCSQFKNFEEFQEKGLGVVALHHGELVSGASSYTIYNSGIEIEIDTKEDYRRKGLALACGAKLILECINRNLYPSWDAHNKGSVALAEKLGYHFDKEYVAYLVYGYGTK